MSSGKLGCIYICPTEKAGHDAEVVYWSRMDEHETGIDERLHAFIQEWIANAWPFKNPAFPGRLISWDDWAQMPDKNPPAMADRTEQARAGTQNLGVRSILKYLRGS